MHTDNLTFFQKSYCWEIIFNAFFLKSKFTLSCINCCALQVKLFGKKKSFLQKDGQREKEIQREREIESERERERDRERERERDIERKRKYEIF